MAYGYTCGLGADEHEADYILTSIRNGQTTAFCAEDSPVALIGALAVELGVDPGKLYEHVKTFVDAEAAAEAAAQVAEIRSKQQKVPRPGGRSRKPRATVTGRAALSPELRGTEDASVSGKGITITADQGADNG